jgi:hypothetical protein
VKQLAFCAALVAAVSAAAPARAFVRQMTSNGTPIAWKYGCVFITPDAKGSTDLPPTITLEQIQIAAMQWVTSTQSCSYMKFNVDQPVSGKIGGLDGTNLVTWLSTNWGRTVKGKYTAYSAEAPALTTLFFVDDVKRPEHGQILDADTELNNVNFHFMVVNPNAPVCPNHQCPGSGECVMDVWNTLQHEFGHMLGLDHTCYNNERGANPIPPPIDNLGDPVPTCLSQLTPAIINATMYNFADCYETKKRMPSSDDIDGICSIYSSSVPTPACVRVQPNLDPSGCQFAPGRPGAVPLVALASVLLLLLERRRRRR